MALPEHTLAGQARETPVPAATGIPDDATYVAEGRRPVARPHVPRLQVEPLGGPEARPPHYAVSYNRARQWRLGANRGKHVRIGRAPGWSDERHPKEPGHTPKPVEPAPEPAGWYDLDGIA